MQEAGDDPNHGCKIQLNRSLTATPCSKLYEVPYRLIIHIPRSPFFSKTYDTVFARDSLPPPNTPPRSLQLLTQLQLQLPLPRLLNNSLISISVVPLLAVGQEPVDDNTTDREDEHKDRPQEFVADGAG